VIRVLPRAATLGLTAALALAAWSHAAGGPGEISVKPVVTTDGRLLVTIAAAGAFDADARTILASGLPLTFTYTLELRRPSTMWFDQTVITVSLSASAKYDALTRTYQVSQSRDGQVVRSKTIEQDADVRTWLTTFENLALAPAAPLVPNGEYYIRVRLRKDLQGRFSLWPFRGDDASGRASFTFIR
jgi:hypothetical protein